MGPRVGPGPAVFRTDSPCPRELTTWGQDQKPLISEEFRTVPQDTGQSWAAAAGGVDGATGQGRCAAPTVPDSAAGVPAQASTGSGPAEGLSGGRGVMQQQLKSRPFTPVPAARGGGRRASGTGDGCGRRRPGARPGECWEAEASTPPASGSLPSPPGSLCHIPPPGWAGDGGPSAFLVEIGEARRLSTSASCKTRLTSASWDQGLGTCWGHLASAYTREHVGTCPAASKPSGLGASTLQMRRGRDSAAGAGGGRCGTGTWRHSAAASRGGRSPSAPRSPSASRTFEPCRRERAWGAGPARPRGHQRRQLPDGPRVACGQRPKSVAKVPQEVSQPCAQGLGRQRLSPQVPEPRGGPGVSAFRAQPPSPVGPPSLSV